MVRRYTLVHGQADGLQAPPVSRHDAADAQGLGERDERLLSLIAQHGVLNTQQVTTLMFDSRPTAARHLNAMVKAGLLRRFVHTRDSTHLAHYDVSIAGADLLRRRLRHAGRPALLGLGQRGHSDEMVVNDFFVRLVAQSRQTGHGHLYRWRHALDTAAWLRSNGILHIAARGYGIWIEDNIAVSFLLHLDADEPYLLTGAPPPQPVALLAGYRQAASGVPVDIALVVTPTTQRERQLHHDIPSLGLPIRIGITASARLREASSPADAIWSIANHNGLIRLIDLATTLQRRHDPNTAQRPKG